jgi:hypothetical protein
MTKSLLQLNDFEKVITGCRRAGHRARRHFNNQHKHGIKRKKLHIGSETKVGHIGEGIPT